MGNGGDRDRLGNGGGQNHHCPEERGVSRRIIIRGREVEEEEGRCPQHTSTLAQHVHTARPYVEPFQVLSNIERHEHQLKVVDPEQGPIACIATRVFGEHGIHMLVRLP